MRHAVPTALLIGLASLAVAADKAPATPPKADSTLEIRSYGEPAEDLSELLAPFLARLDFAEFRRFPTKSEKYVATELRHPDGDRVYILGGPNCLVVGYFSTRHPAYSLAVTPVDRAERFRAQLKTFLEGLPTPRPRGFDSYWSPNTWCHQAP